MSEVKASVMAESRGGLFAAHTGHLTLHLEVSPGADVRPVARGASLRLHQ
jgi:hypothetical protein